MQYKNVLTTCPYCGVGCGVHLQVLDGQTIGVLPSKTHPVAQGRLCVKGWNAHAFINHQDRLKTPLIRGRPLRSDGEWRTENGDEPGGRLNGFRQATWDEALSLVAERLGEIKAAHGPDAIGVLASAKCTNEENYVLQKFTRAVIGTNNVDHCARL